MAKSNQFHRAGNRYRRLTGVKIPVGERDKNKNKWKTTKEYKNVVKSNSRSSWWKKKRGEK